MNLAQKITIIVIVAIILGVLSTLVLGPHHKLWSLGVFVFVTVIGLLVVLIEHDHDKNENFSLGGSGCNQTINITQNCNDNDNPWLPVNPALDKKLLENWIKSVDPGMTKQCQKCIITSAMRLWSGDTLQQVMQKSKVEQLQILHALLLLDCDKQCVITPNNLDRTVVTQWLITVFGEQIDENCFDCVLNTIMKLWKQEDLQKAMAQGPEQQKQIIEALWLLHCQNCQKDKVKPSDAINWLTTVLTGATQKCYKCAVDTIVRLWSNENFKKVKKMNKNSQSQIAQALLALNCEKKCIVIPTGLNKQQVTEWVSRHFVGTDKQCLDCLVNAIMQLWTPAMMKNLLDKPLLEQDKVLQGLLLLNCHSQCISGKELSREQVEQWVAKIFPDSNKSCQSCIVDKGMQTWSNEEFHKLKSLPTSDQAKLAKLFADFNCPHVCELSPYKDCDYLPY